MERFDGPFAVKAVAAFGPWLLFTSVRSPSNGIAKASVRMLMRDYARLAILADAETVMRLPPVWFENYDTVVRRVGG